MKRNEKQENSQYNKIIINYKVHISRYVKNRNHEQSHKNKIDLLNLI